MADPQRLLDDPSLSPLGRAVLRAAAEDAPPSGGRAAAARRLGVALGIPAIAAVTGEASAVATTTAFWWKLVVIAIAFGGAASYEPARPPATVAAIPRAEAPPPAHRAESRLATPAPVAAPTPPPVATPTPPAAPPSTPRATPSARAPRDARAATQPPPVPTAPATEPPPAEPAPVEAPAPVVEAPPPTPVDARRLAAEVALLDRARAALRGGDARGALGLLDEHHRTFPDGVLVAEADLVRIEALLRLDRRSEAVALGNAFLARSPRSPFAKRVQSLIAK